MNFGEKLKSYRKKHRLTQEELAAKLQTSQSSIHLYEEGKRKPSTAMVARTARLLNLNAYELAALVSGAEFVKDPEFDYGASLDVEHAVELMYKYLNEDDQSFVVQVIYELIRNKGIKDH
ncbi:MAG: helix-turn-helix transcriptional regulator [Bacillota bacterium]|nr:helix-turn-helix transcriptional regulator [Bacillota bacterium]